jgi:biopolymer transport protein ExbD
MKFPRNARIFRGQLDAAPFATVFFLLVIFMMLGSLVYTPGVHLNLPPADELPGALGATVTVAIDPYGRYYFGNTNIDEKPLRNQLRLAQQASPEPLTLVIQADSAVTYEMLMHLTLLGRDAGITNGHLATLPRPLPGSPAVR